MIDLKAYLSENSYPGRGILLGRSADNTKAVIAYFIMGRSENSRNRIFETTDDGIRTKAFDESKMVDPSLIIYHPVRVVEGTTIVTNGDQTDTVANAFRDGTGWVRALRTREFEPDGPNYTPRISGMVRPDGSTGCPSSNPPTATPPAASAFSLNTMPPSPVRATLSAPTRPTAIPCPPSRARPRPWLWAARA